MAIKWYVKLILSLAFMHVVVIGGAQNNLKYRISASSGMLLNEKNVSSIIDPAIVNLIAPGGVDEFKPEVKVGFELEISLPVNELFSVGLEFESYTLGGVNKNPVYYNYFATTKFPYHQEALMHTTYLNNLIGNFRYYPMGIKRFQPFVKIFGGVSFVGTNLQFYDPQNQVSIFDPLYARGTQNSTETKWPTFYYGTGLGFEYHLSEFVSLYFDASLSIIDTDLVDGVPNFSYNEKTGINDHIHTKSYATQVSIGFCYSFYKSSNTSGESSPKKTLFKKRKGKIDKFFPFHEIKK